MAVWVDSNVRCQQFDWESNDRMQLKFLHLESHMTTPLTGMEFLIQFACVHSLKRGREIRHEARLAIFTSPLIYYSVQYT